MILSASRRTDIPSFYSEWFLKRLRDGYVLTRNPMNSSQISRILLSPSTISCIVFWTKDPNNMLDKLQEMNSMGYHYYFQFTLNPYGKEIERNLRDKKDIIITFRQLSDRIGKDKVIWRYDPIIMNDDFTMEYHINKFTELCQQLQGYTNICTISFVDTYSKLSKWVKEKVIKNISEQTMHHLAAELSEIGKKYGIELRACCEQVDFHKDGIKPASCIDKDLIERICGHVRTEKNDKNQRQGCGCIQSVDIGVYNTCSHGCVYCYANHSEASIYKNCIMHDPEANIMIGSVGMNEKIIARN